jgi:hypothetical protein
MESVVHQLGIVACVLIAALIGPLLALFLLVHRKRRARARRRSPISISLLRSPGNSLREQLDEAAIDMAFDLIILSTLPLMSLALYLAQGHVRGLQAMAHLTPLYFGIPLAVVSFVVRRLWKTGTRVDKLRAGFDAELAVGQELDQLARSGAVIFHDLPAENFNIDHVVISSEGVFAVETKGFTKPNRGRGKADATVEFDGGALRFPLWTTQRPLQQATRQAEWLSRWLSSAVGSSIPVRPVLALPGWFVKRTGSGDVRVYSGRELSGLLSCRDAARLSAQDVRQIAHQVEQRCRTVAPRYAEEKRAG